jgi:hypothetical protein
LNTEILTPPGGVDFREDCRRNWRRAGFVLRVSIKNEVFAVCILKIGHLTEAFDGAL